MLDKFQMELSVLGYSLTMHRILADELDAMKLPEIVGCIAGDLSPVRSGVT